MNINSVLFFSAKFFEVQFPKLVALNYSWGEEVSVHFADKISRVNDV